MNPLAASHRGELTRLAAARTLLAFDYDGVLAPLIRDPHGAEMRASTRKLLRAVVARWPVAVVSGRAYADTLRLSHGIASTVVGNHGFELGHARPVPRAVLALVQGWRRALEEALDGEPVYFEDKRSTLAIHYGLERRWRRVETAVHDAAGALDGARLVHGKKVLNVLPAGFPNKGDAILALLGKLRLDVALYVGDDVTDEDAFRVGPPRVVGVRVGPGRTLAPWRLADQRSVDLLLDRLASLRAAPPRRSRSGAGAVRASTGPARAEAARRPGARS
jgi:trehalose 6-phosphate phosphatase